MQIEIPDAQEVEAQAHAAGFATVEDYIIRLIDRDAERLAIQRGIDDFRAGHIRPFPEFDAELRSNYGLPPRP